MHADCLVAAFVSVSQHATPAHLGLSCAHTNVQDTAGLDEMKTDASGNPILKDVGPWLKSEMKRHFKDADVKYIDPS